MKYDLALVPGDSFGCPGYFRMAYCIDTEKVRRSFAALEKFVAEEYGEMNSVRAAPRPQWEAKPETYDFDTINGRSAQCRNKNVQRRDPSAALHPAARSSNMQRRRAVSRKQNRRVHALITLIFCIAVFILVCAGCFLLVKTDGTITNKPNQSQGDSSSTAPDGADSTTDGDSQQEQPTMTEEERRICRCHRNGVRKLHQGCPAGGGPSALG